MKFNARLGLIALCICVPTALFAGGGGGEGSDLHNLIPAIGISILASTVVAFLGHLLKQPLLLMYIAAGAIIGPQVGLGLVTSQEEINIISEIGLILLLFMIGLEIDVKKLLEAGKTLILSGIFQFIICVALGLVFFGLMGYSLEDNFGLIYLTVCVGLSSTTIVVKTLYSKFELDTLAGRISLGVLIFQDIWAILFLAIQPNLANPEATVLLASLGKAVGLVAIALLMSKYVLPWLFKSIAKVPELLLVSSLGWCFFICGIAQEFELSIEMGALIAGVAISTFPYNLDVIAKVTNIRDFFVTLFFVALGMQVPNPLENLELVYIALAVVAFVIFARFISLYPLLYGLKNGHRVSILSFVNLSNVSEFSMVIATIGLALGHIDQQILTTTIFIFVITSIIAPYAIKYNDSIQRMLTPIFLKLGLKDISEANEQAEAESHGADIVILGFFREASSLVQEIEDYDIAHAKESGVELKGSVQVIDLNPEVHQKLKKKGLDAIYGDISHMDTLHHAGIHHAKIVISTISDSILVGTDNLRLIKQIKTIAPHAKIIVTAESMKRALNMYQEGADFVLLPRIQSAQKLLPVIVDFLNHEDQIEDYRKEQIEMLKGREEIIS